LKYIENDSRDPFFNLAMEEYLFNDLDMEREGYMLLWQNDPTVVVGRFQNTLREIDREFVTSGDINVVRRMSGGGAVYHDHGNLNYTFIVHTGKDSPFKFALYTKPIIDILKTLGVNADFTSRNDLTIDGKKFSGNAQYMRKGKLLHHGTLLFDSDLDILIRALNVSEDKFISKGIKSARSRVTNIRPHLPEPMDISAFKDAIVEKLTLSGELSARRSLSDEEVDKIALLADSKYRTWDWNFGRSPEFSEKKSKRFASGKVEALIKVECGVIANCRFYGDFFCNGDIRYIEDRIKGTPYRKDDLQRVLESVPVEDYFMGITKEEFLSFIAP